MFGMTTSRDFLWKLEALDDFMKEPRSARLAVNCALTAYHLHDWVWREWLKNDKTTRQALGTGKHKREFLAWIDRACPMVHLDPGVGDGRKAPRAHVIQSETRQPFARGAGNAGMQVRWTAIGMGLCPS